MDSVEQDIHAIFERIESYVNLSSLNNKKEIELALIALGDSEINGRSKGRGDAKRLVNTDFAELVLQKYIYPERALRTPCKDGKVRFFVRGEKGRIVTWWFGK